MLIRRIQAKNFMKYDSIDIEFPQRGIILVTGANGSGKSSLQEAVNVAYWGKTLRKTPPWRKGVDGSVTVESAEVIATRKCTKKGAASLSFTAHNKPFDKRKYNTPTKAQAALDALVMSSKLWARTHVFSPTTAAHFTMAKDSDRKHLIESFLGLEMFDGGLALCRIDLKKARERCDAVRSEISTFDARSDVYARQRENAVEAVARAKELLDQDEEAAANVPTDDELKKLVADLVDVKAALTDSQTDLQEVADRFIALTRTVSDAETRLRVANERDGALAQPKCPTCGQVIPKERREAVEDALRQLRARVAQVRKTADGEEKALKATKIDLEEEADLLRDRATKLDGDLRVAREQRRVASSEAAAERRKTAEENLRSAEATLAGIDKSIADLKVARKKATSSQTEAESRVTFLEVVERVLGLRGVRVQVLAKALDGINDLASYWLSQITNDPNATMLLKPYSEKKDGNISDALSLEVTGFGGGYGYLAASSGERRRIDVPITMALATVADAALGAPQGTLWMDEIFDNLDDFGVEAVSGALDELAQERPVVVISHSLAVVSRLKPILHIHVDAGRIITKS